MEDYGPTGINNNNLERKVQQLKEMFRISDTEALKLLEQHNGDLERVVSSADSRDASQAEGVASSHMARSAGDGSSVDHATGTEQDPIDLTKDGGDQDMQKALMLSMQEMQSTTGGGVISLEEQELSRALEASLRENSANMSKPVLALFQDPKNPHKRKRVGNTPVGLKNIGNTCWFSAVIQSLYHVLAFRREILSYYPPPLPNGTTSYPQCVTFVLELQKIFALLLKSHKMYIDPSPAIQAFSKEHSHTGAQQDVSEFTHKLLEWIENAFKLSLETHPSESGNPIVNLFNGHYKTEGINNDDKPFINKSDFGAYPIQVRGHTHLHDSLESAIFNTEMKQQTFFTQFPPILVLELSRFQYNKHTRQAEKIHDQLNFDLELYIDRYLEENKVESCQRKVEVDELRKKIKELNTRLEWYLHYHQKPISITDILSLTLTFVRDEKMWELEEIQSEGRGEERAEKRARTSLYPSPRYKSEQELDILERCLTRWSEELFQDIEDLRLSIATSQESLDAVYNDALMKRTPFYLHSVMVHQGEASGGHYWAYTRKHPSLSLVPIRQSPRSDDVSGNNSVDKTSSGEGESSEKKVVGDLSAQTGQTGLIYHTRSETGEICSESEVMRSPESMYASEDFCSVPSSASALNVTQNESGGTRGEGMEVERCGLSGDTWLKFNDVSVSEVDWEEVKRESLGGTTSNTSAYCLVYINKLLHEEWLNSATPPSLSEDLLKMVEENNSSFMKELIDHDRNIQTASHINNDVMVGGDGRPPSPLPVVMSPAASGSAAAPPENALPAGPRQEERSPQELMQIDSPPPPPVSPGLQTKLNSLVSSHIYRVHQFIKQYDEPRLLNLPSYAAHCDSSKQILRLLVLDEIAFNHSDERIKMLAKREYVHGLSAITKDNNNPLNLLKQNYHIFVCVCWLFVQAMRMARDRNFTETLLLCLKASHLHKTIISPKLSLQPPHLDLLIFLKCRALQEVSSKAYKMFERGEIKDGIQIANTLVVPALAQLSRESRTEGEKVLEKVREEWCQCLNRPDLNEGEQDQLGDLLTRILDDSGKIPSLPDFQGSDIDLENLDHHALVVDMGTHIRYLTLQLSANPFVGL